MFGISRYIAAGVGLSLILSLGWGLRVDHLRDGWRTRYITETGEVTATIRRVTGNSELKWKDASPQIEALAGSRQRWKNVAGEQSAAIDALGTESQRLKRLNTELRIKAEKIIKDRAKLIDRLVDQAKTPGDREDCQAQIAAAEAALDAIYDEGL